MTTTQKGEFAAIKVRLRCLEKGFTFCQPIIEGSRYDAVIDTGQKLLKVQIKYADGRVTSSTGVVCVSLAKAVARRAGGPYTFKTYSSNELDLVIVYVPKTDEIYAFPPEVFAGKRSFTLRIAAAKNGQAKGCRMAESFKW